PHTTQRDRTIVRRERHPARDIPHADRPVVGVELQIGPPGRIDHEAHAPRLAPAGLRPVGADRTPRRHNLDLAGDTVRLVLSRGLRLDAGVDLDAVAIPPLARGGSVPPRIDGAGPGPGGPGSPVFAGPHA